MNNQEKQLKRIADLLEYSLGDTDSNLPDDQDVLEDEFPVHAAMQLVVELMLAARATPADQVNAVFSEVSKWVDAHRIPFDDQNELFKAIASALSTTRATPADQEPVNRIVARLKIEKLAQLLTETEKTKRDILDADGETVSGVRIGWGAWALLRAKIIDVIETKCEDDACAAKGEEVTTHKILPGECPSSRAIRGCHEPKIEGTPKSAMTWYCCALCGVKAPRGQGTFYATPADHISQARDAARYRRVRKWVYMYGVNNPTADELDDILDAHIAAAMKSAPPEKPAGDVSDI